MARFVRFTNFDSSTSDPVEDIFVNPDHVRSVVGNAGGGTILRLEGEEIRVRQEIRKVIEALS